jgi:hypothetical protein
MSRRPALVTEADINRVIRAAKKAGATEVEVRLGDQASVRIPLLPDKVVADSKDIVL